MRQPVYIRVLEWRTAGWVEWSSSSGLEMKNSVEYRVKPRGGGLSGFFEVMMYFEIRKAFLDFFKERGHEVLPSSSLIPQNDPSLLFVNAGMNQFKSVILGLEKPSAKNVVTIQKCMRAGGKHNDLENVGQTSRHNTFFEMMGNFSFGGYFKQKAIALAWELFTERLKMNPEHLWVSVYEKDEESYEIWRDEQKIPEHKIYRMGKEDNFWQMGDTGPCGPCTEIHYYKGTEKRPNPDQLMEFGNLVFMEFDDKGKGQREKLSIPCVDTGMGLERICAILQNKRSIYHTDCFKGIIQSLEEASGCKYDFTEKSQSEKQMAFRVIADHSRAAAFLMSDGVLPGNEGQSYVLRRILRRAFFYSGRLNSKKNLLSVASQKVVDFMGEIYPALRDVEIEFQIQDEAELFMESLKTGRNMLFKKMKDLPNKTIPDSLVWHLYSTYGFPPDLTRLITKEKGFKVNESFNLEEFKEEKKTSFLRIVEKDSLRNFKSQYPLNRTEPTYYEKSQEKSQITQLVFIKNEDVMVDGGGGYSSISQAPKLLEQVNIESMPPDSNNGLWLITDKTCFYPKGDDPIWDKGILETETGQAKVLDCLQIGDSIFHRMKILKGELKKGQQCTMEVDANHRQFMAAGHSVRMALRRGITKTEFTGYKKNQETGKILLSVSLEKTPVERDQEGGSSMMTGASFSSLKQGQKGWLITDTTCFYPEGGGPIGDKGILETETGQAAVLDCKKEGPLISHEVKVTEGELKEGQQCTMKVDADHRRLIASGHSATHLLHQALREELGASVQQKGSLVKPGWLRFDFSHPKPLTEDQISEIEKQVKKNIQSKNPVSDSEHSYKEAVQSGALFLAGENYSSRVRVITMGDSREFCGGIHVKNTSDIGCFKIISETGVQSGVRRITAYTSDKADKWLNLLARQNFDLRKYLENLSGAQDRQQKSSEETAPATVMNKGKVSDFTKSNRADEGNLSGTKTDEALSQPPMKGINPFISWMKAQDEEIKQLKNQLKNLIPPEKRTGDQSKTFQSEHSLPSVLKNEDYDKWIERNPKYRDLLAEQILELKKYLKLPALKDIESPSEEKEKSPFISLMESKREEVQSLKSQLENLPWDLLSVEKLKKQVKPFQMEDIKGGLLVMDLPVTDRKILADMADQLKLKISSGVVALLGEGKKSWPLMVTVTKDLQQHISAGELMKKTIAPLLDGKGGGQARFAQGTITNRENFPKLEKALLQVLRPVPSEKWQISETGKSLRDIFPFRLLRFENLSLKGSLAGASFSLAVLAGIYTFMLSDGPTPEKRASLLLKSAKVEKEVEQWKKAKKLQKQASGGFPASVPQAREEMGDEKFRSMTSVQSALKIRMLTLEQIQKLSSEEIQKWTSDQIRLLTVEQIQALTSEQIQSLTADQVQSLTPEQIQSFTPEQAKALTSEQIQFLTPEQLHILTPKRIKAVSPK